MKNRTAVCEFSFPRLGPIAIQLAGKASFDGIQLIDTYELAQGAPLLNPAIRETYVEAAEKYNIAFQGLHLYSLCHADILGSTMDSVNGEIIQQNIKNAVETCKLMNIPVIMMNFNGHHLNRKPCTEQWDNAAEALKFGYNLCEDNGIRLTIETLHTPEKFAKLREKIGENLKICFDTLIPKVHDAGIPAELIQGYGIEAIDHFHVHDCLPDDRGYFTVHTLTPALIGEGKSGFYECAEVINSTDFSGWFVSETCYFNPVLLQKQNVNLDYAALASKDVWTLREAFMKEI